MLLNQGRSSNKVIGDWGETDRNRSVRSNRLFTVASEAFVASCCGAACYKHLRPFQDQAWDCLLIAVSMYESLVTRD